MQMHVSLPMGEAPACWLDLLHWYRLALSCLTFKKALADECAPHLGPAAVREAVVDVQRQEAVRQLRGGGEAVHHLHAVQAHVHAHQHAQPLLPGRPCHQPRQHLHARTAICHVYAAGFAVYTGSACKAVPHWCCIVACSINRPGKVSVHSVSASCRRGRERSCNCGSAVQEYS